MFSVLLHTMHDYRFCWGPFGYYWDKYVRYEGPKYFVSDIPDTLDSTYDNWRLIYTGRGEWSDRLSKALESIDTKWVFYVQEDVWAKRDFYLDTCDPVARGWDKRFDCIHINPTKSFLVRRVDRHGPFVVHDDSPCLVCHKPALWRKDFLLEQLDPGEDPWVNEVEGTKRLRRQGTLGRIGLLRKGWYHDVCSKGELLQTGKDMMDDYLHHAHG